MLKPVKTPTYSVTSLLAYERCPLQYHTTYVRKIPPPITAGMRRGTTIHGVIARLYRDPTIEITNVDADARTMLETFKRSRFNVTPLWSEKPFLLPVDYGTVRGRIDLVLPGLDGGYEVVDFKSGGSPSRDELERNLQLPLYAIAISHLFDVPHDKLAYTYYFLRHNAEVSFLSGEEQVRRVTRRVEGIIEAIQNEQFDPVPDCMCYACEWDRRWRERRTSASRPLTSPASEEPTS